MKTPRRKEISSPEKVRWGFAFVIFFMLGLSVFLTVSAGSRFSGTAWGSLINWKDAEVSHDGFIVMDLSDTLADDAPMHGAAYAALRTEERDAGSAEAIETLALPSELDAISALPNLESMTGPPPTIAEQMASLQPPSLSEPIGDFGPLPSDWAELEPIILNTTDDGLRLPDDALEISSDAEMSDVFAEIELADVGVSWKEHIVKSGETLSDIALQYGGVTAQDILKANGLKDANRLTEKQILLIPNTPTFIDDTLAEVRTRKARVAALREQVVPVKFISYVVAAGDSLWSIASAQNLEVDTLVGSNKFKNSSVLHPGAVLRIPNQDGIFYAVKKGDKIENVAKRYQVSMDKIRQVNPTVDLVSIKAGSEIFLPGARPEAVAETARSTNKKTSAAKGSGAQKSSRSFRWPVMGKINSPYGWRRHPITKRRDFHTGLDIKASRGTVIRGSREGRVAYAGWMGGYGKVVVVEHSGGQSTLYAHCSSLLVPKGARVSPGQNIARVGSTGRATGPHLHFEIRNGNKPVNPLQHLR